MISHGARDISDGLKKFSICWNLAKDDLYFRYKKTVFGPFWMTLLTAIHIAGLSLVFGTAFRITIEDFIPYLATGLIIWQFISATLNEGSKLFEVNSSLIGNVNFPYTFYALRTQMRILINFMHNAVALIAVLLIFPHNMDWTVLTIIPALVLFCITGVAMLLLVGLMCIRFSDVKQLIEMLLTLSFLMTPIIWKKAYLEEHSWLVDFNPLFHFIELIRAPLMGQELAVTSWVVATGFTVVTSLLTITLLGRYKNRIPYWI